MPGTNKPAHDLIQELIEDCLMAFPVSSLLISLYKQYGQRGFLTKKQMEALHKKASEAPGISPAKLATLEAMIRKLPTRYKSALPENTPMFRKDEESAGLAEAILAKYPQHKRVLFLRSKVDDNTITAAERDELKKFARLLKI